MIQYTMNVTSNDVPNKKTELLFEQLILISIENNQNP